MKPKVTPWIDGSVSPVRVGVYQRLISGLSNDSGQYAYWNGKFWGMFVGCCDTPDRAVFFKNEPTMYHGLKWRGLAQKPESV